MTFLKVFDAVLVLLDLALSMLMFLNLLEFCSAEGGAIQLNLAS